MMLQYGLKISEPSNMFSTHCKLRVKVLVEKSNVFANKFFTNAFGLCYSPLGCDTLRLCCCDVKKGLKVDRDKVNSEIKQTLNR